MALRVLTIPLVLAVLVLTVFPRIAEGKAGSSDDYYEVPPVLRASDVLPAKSLRGPDHRVQEAVYNDGFYNRYNVQTTFGRFTVEGTDLLMIRLSEIDAIRRMEDLKSAQVYGDAVKEAATGPLRLAKGVVTDPVDTVSDVGTGIGKFFGNVAHATFGETSEREEGAAKVILGYDAYKRRFAHQFGVDPYSSNEALQERLNEVSWTGFAGGMTVRVAFKVAPGPGGVVLTTTGFSNSMSQLVAQKTPAELREVNDGKLKAMGVHKSVRQIFLEHPKFSPTQTTFLVGALDLMKGVADRQIFIQVASLVQDEALAFWRRRQAEMMAAYHLKVAPVARVTRLTHTSALQRKDGRVVALFPNGHVAWMRTLERLERSALRSYEKLPNGTGRELWVQGTVSPLARRELESAGWVVEENVLKKLSLE